MTTICVCLYLFSSLPLSPLSLSLLFTLSFSVCMCVPACECVSLYMLQINCKTQNQQMTILLIWIIVCRSSSVIFLQSIDKQSIWLLSARFPKWNEDLNELGINKQNKTKQKKNRTCAVSLLWSLLFQRVNKSRFALGVVCSYVHVCVL